MNVEEYRARLQGRIDALVSGACSVKEFDAQYYRFCLTGFRMTSSPMKS